MSRIANRTVVITASRTPTRRKSAGRTRSRARAIPPPTIRPAPTSSGARTGSCRKTEAIATATSGAVPMSTEERAAPTSRTARTKKTCERPGASSPAIRNGQISARSSSRVAARPDDRGQDEGEGRHRERAELCVLGAADAESNRDRHRAEQRGRRARERDCCHSGCRVNRAGTVSEAAAVVPGAHGDDLREDRDGRLRGSRGTEVEPGGTGEPVQRLLREPGFEQLLAPARLRLAGADRADVEGVARRAPPSARGCRAAARARGRRPPCRRLPPDHPARRRRSRPRSAGAPPSRAVAAGRSRPSASRARPPRGRAPRRCRSRRR